MHYMRKPLNKKKKKNKLRILLIKKKKMFSALKKLTKSGDDRCPAPVPMSSSLQKKFSRGVHFNLKILIKGDRNVGKSCLLQRLQGGPFIEDYVPTEQIQVAPIHWTYKDTDHIVKVEVWEVVDKGRIKKKAPLGLKLENLSAPIAEDKYETPVLDATFLDVYKNANGVILMFDITKPWTFDYVVKELSRVPADLPVITLGNHCDMQHHRQVHSHHIDQALNQAKMTRTAPVRYAESSMRNGFGLRLLHKFLGVPFLRLQKTSLLEQLQRNRKDMEEIEKDLDDFQNSEESQYNLFVDRLANKRRQNNPADTRPSTDRSPSIVLGAGKPIIPPNVNPLLAQSLNPMGITAQHSVAAPHQETQPSQYTSPEPKQPLVSMNVTPSRVTHQENIADNQPAANVSAPGSLDEFYAGALDSSFLEDLQPLPTASQEYKYGSDSDDENATNPRVNVDQDDLDVDSSPTDEILQNKFSIECTKKREQEDYSFREQFSSQILINENNVMKDRNLELLDNDPQIHLTSDHDYPLWTGDSSARRSPEGGEDPDVAKEVSEKVEKKHKKKKSKDKGDHSDKSERKEKKHKHKKSREKAPSLQQDLLSPTGGDLYSYDDYDSI